MYRTSLGPESKYQYSPLRTLAARFWCTLPTEYTPRIKVKHTFLGGRSMYNPENPHISIESRPVLRENKPDNGPTLCTLNRCLSTTQLFHSLRPHLLSSSDWHLRPCEKPLRRELSLLRFRIATGRKLNRSGCPPSLSGCPQGACLVVSPRSAAIPVYAFWFVSGALRCSEDFYIDMYT